MTITIDQVITQIPHGAGRTVSVKPLSGGLTNQSGKERNPKRR